MTEFGYKDDKLNTERNDVKTSVDFLTMLKDFVLSNYISEWQAGYITAMLNCQFDAPIDIDNERVYKQLLTFIWSYIYNKEDIYG